MDSATQESPAAAPSPTTLSVLEWLFDHEATLPKDAPSLMKRIGWVWSQRQYASGDSEWHDLYERLVEACSHSMTFVYDPVASVMINSESLSEAYRSPPPCWRIVTSTHMEYSNRIQGGKCTFGYYSASGKFHAVVWAKRSNEEHHAYFALQGIRVYLFQIPPSDIFGRREVVFLHLNNGAAGTPGEPLRLHVMKPASGVFVYTHCWQPYYSSTQSWMPFLRGQNCVHLWHFTMTATVLYAQSRFRGTSVNGTAFPVGLDERVLHKMVDYDQDTLLDQFGQAHDRIWSIHRGLLRIAPTQCCQQAGWFHGV